MRKSQIYNYTPAELQELLDISHSYSEILIAIGLSTNGGCHETLKRIIKEYNLDTTIFLKNKQEFEQQHASVLLHVKYSLEDILVENSSYVNNSSLKKRLVNEGIKELKCERCGLTEWQGHQIPLQLHHKNGIHTDNRLENLEFLCPNCHSLTDTYAGKNVKYEKEVNLCKCCGAKITKKATYCKHCAPNQTTGGHKEYHDRSYLKSVIYDHTFAEIGREFDVNGNTIKKWCKKLNLPHKKSDILRYTREEWEAL